MSFDRFSRVLGFALPLLAALVFPALCAARDVSLADHLPDPGFEESQTKTSQINARGVTSIGGWSATPANANFWTSVAYMTRGAQTLGDKRETIAPESGRGYLRMFTMNSSEWLSLTSPAFELKTGETYVVAFSISADSQPPMARLDVALRDMQGVRHGLKTFDLISIQPGWNTIVYRHRYTGPDQSGVLELMGRREKTGKTGALNIDNFRTPSAEDETEAATGLKSMEVIGLRVSLPVTESAWGRPVMPLKENAVRVLPLKTPGVTAGKYRLLVKLRAADRSGNEGDSMLGGYTYLLPRSLYHFELDGKPVPMEISPRMVRAEGREGDEETAAPVFTGWVYSATPVPITEASRLAVSCTKPGAFVSEVLLLDDDRWETEKLRSSDLFTTPPGKGFGNAWASMLTRPVQWYSLQAGRRLSQALQAFDDSAFVKKAGAADIDFAELLKNGGALVSRIDSFVGKPVRNDDDVVREGAGLAKEWRGFFAQADQSLRTQLASRLAGWSARARAAHAKGNAECHDGREARFNAEVALRYLTEGLRDLESLSVGEIQDGASEIRLLTFAQNGVEFMLKAEEFTSRPQVPVVLADYVVKPALPDISVQGKPSPLPHDERLVINGEWSFAPGEPDHPPSRWSSLRIPSNGPAYAFNGAGIDDDRWARDFGIYWASGNIKDAWFRTDFAVPSTWSRGAGKVVVRFEELMLYGEIFINGRYCGNHYGGFIPFEIDVTDKLVAGVKNNLLVFVSSHSKTARGLRKDSRDKGMIFGNLYPRSQLEGNELLRISGNVELVAKPFLRVENVYVRTSLAEPSVTVSGVVVNESADDFAGTLKHTVLRAGKPVSDVSLPEMQVRMAAGERKPFTITADWKKPALWGIGGAYGSPENLYRLKSTLAGGDGGAVRGEAFTEFGFRELSVKGRDFMLNGRRMPIQGDSFSDSGRYEYQHNRWVQAQANRLRRSAWINTVRPHRFNFTEDVFDAARWTGMLLEAEAPWWSINLYAPDDITGEPSFDDPVWLANAEDYYRTIVRAHRNEPAFVLWSVENESLTAANAGAVMKFRQWSAEEAPHLIITDHSHASAWDERLPVAVLHDYDLGVPRLKEWTRVSELSPRPVVIGEFWNIDLYRKMWVTDVGQARGAERIMSRWLERTDRAYADAGASGSMPYTFFSMGAVFSAGETATMGPWGDLLQARRNDSDPERRKLAVVVHPEWPSLSGQGGLRPDRKRLAGDNYQHINVFDPRRPVATPTSVIEGYRKGFEPMPEEPILRPPELLVRIVRAGVPVPGVNVFVRLATGLQGEVAGVKGDTDGKSWLQLSEAGTYRVWFEHEGRRFEHTLPLAKTRMEGAGFGYLPRLTWDVATGVATLTPGTEDVAAALLKPSSAVEKSRATVRDYSRLPMMGENGFIRRWLVLGPFPNHGGRNRPESRAFEQDLLHAEGGEARVQPAPGGDRQTVVYKRDDEQAYWQDGSIDIGWKEYGSEGDRVNLSDALVQPGFPGLEGALQYVFGYAACYVESETDRDAVLTIGSDDGYKLWLNDKLIAAKRVYRGCKPDSEKYPVRLKAGWNRVLVKVEQDDGGYEFAIRLLDDEGKPLKPRIRLAPPEAAAAPAPPLRVGRWLTDWLVCGPFANGGGRPARHGFDTDFIKEESAVRPAVGSTVESVFPKDDQAYWEKGTISVAWKKQVSPTNDIDLGEALLRPDVSGLDVAPVQYAAGYAWTEFTVAQPTTLSLEVVTFNGVKVWLNGKPVIADAGYTFNRDPNSPVLPPSYKKNLRVPVTLPAGVNRLLVKADVDYGPFGFRLRITEPISK